MTRATQWHDNRRALLLKEAELKRLRAPSPWSAIALIGVPTLHFILCYVSTRLNVWQTFLLAYFPGSVVFMYLFSNAHEIFHGALGKALRHHRFKNIFLRLATVTDISSGLYLYYKYGHGPHHFDQGTHNIDSLHQKYLVPSLDLDPVTQFKNIYKFKLSLDSEPQYRFPAIEHNRFLRFCAIFLMPLVDTVRELLVEPIKLFNWFRFKDAPWSRRTIENAFVQGILIISILVAMGLLFRSWNHLLYVFFCRICFLGFLHPYGILWATTHSSVDENGVYQPAMSIQGKLSTFLCAGINLHVEHHDLPWVPRGVLKRAADLRPDLYESLSGFSGFVEAARNLFRKHYVNVYSP